MNSKHKSNTPHSSDSLGKSLPLPKTGFQKNVTSKLYLAKKKLLPVINDVMKTAKENGSRKPYPLNKSYYLTVDQYQDAVWASQLLKEVDEMFKFNKSRKYFTKTFKTHMFNLEHAKIKVNRHGKIHVDTSILVQLIELHNMLGKIIDYIQEMPPESQTEAQTETDNLSKRQDDTSDTLDEKKHGSNENNGKQTKLTKKILTSLATPFSTNFVVMTAQSPVSKKYSTTEATIDHNIGTRKTKSTSSLMYNEGYQVTDAAGARRIIVRCMSDLDKVRHYLEKGYVTGVPTLDRDSDDDQGTYKQQQPDSRHSVKERDRMYKKSPDREHTDMDDPKCFCADECPADQPLEFTWRQEGGKNSQLVIFIKGKSEDDGDVHVVIKQCPECKKHDQPIGLIKQRSESAILHGKEPEDTCEESSSEDMDKPQYKNINVIFNPNDPSSSVVEGVTKKRKVAAEKQSNIKLNETVNLNLHTNQGQDLVISLTVRPKFHKRVSILHLKDILSESKVHIPPERDYAELVDKGEDPGILISRTKICSSLEFDVKTVNSRLRSTGIKHKNANTELKLNDIGVNNLLMASRPAKCGRKAILNETAMNCLPYSASLKSLPLEEGDAEVIDQSFNMSRLKCKHSNIYIKDPKLSYAVEPINRKQGPREAHTKQIYFMHVVTPNNTPKRFSRTEQFLSFYINLESDIEESVGKHIYEVRYFEIEDIKKDLSNATDPPETVFSVRLKHNGRSNDVAEDDEFCNKVVSKKDSARFPSRIPVPVRNGKGEPCKNKFDRKPNVPDVGLTSLPRERIARGFAVNCKSLIKPPKQAMTSRNTLKNQAEQCPSLSNQVKNKSLMTMKNSNHANTIKIFSPNTPSAESMDYFKLLLRNSALRHSTMSTERKKRKEFYLSRSQSLILPRTYRKQGCLGDTKETTECGQKRIKLNNDDMSKTRFKKQLDHEKSLSRLMINDLSTLIYENFIEDLSIEAKIEIFRKIDKFLILFSRMKMLQSKRARKKENSMYYSTLGFSLS
ncbi:hypothetical protein JTB14_020165 [Gonioctena quinquepunctata]|nr:hypothetical protein JTB14_020165 [Gonioctena quinquepunctata]